jgi:hypothetical protein
MKEDAKIKKKKTNRLVRVPRLFGAASFVLAVCVNTTMLHPLRIKKKLQLQR